MRQSSAFLAVVFALALGSAGAESVLAQDVRGGDTPVLDTSTPFDEMTPAEKTQAKQAARDRKMQYLRVCADPGNLPFSDIKGGGYDNKIVAVLAKALGAQPVYFWRPYIERGLTRETFSNNECDILMDMPTDTEGLLTTDPIYRTTYVLASRSDSGLNIKNFDDPKLKDLKIGVFQQSPIRDVLAMHGVTDNVVVRLISHDADLEPEKAPWRQVQDVVDRKLDMAGVFGPFAGYVKSQGAPLTVQPVNLWEDNVPLQFDLAIGMPRTDVVLKYMLDDALERSKDEIAKILADYGVPLVQCSHCLVTGDLPAHGSYETHLQEEAQRRFLEPLPKTQTQLDKKEASPDQIVTDQRLEEWLKEGADVDQELSDAVLASDAERIKFLLAHGAHIDKLNKEGLAPLHVAARERDSDTVGLLLSLHADPNVRDSDGWTPLLHAAFRNHVPSIKVLLAHGADPQLAATGGYTPLAIALEEGQFFAASALIDGGAKVNAAGGPENLTPLMVLASQPQAERRSANLLQGPNPLDLARTLIKKGANVNAVSATGVTPLMVAAVHNNPAMIGLLLQAGANADAKTPDGKTAIDLARDNNSDAAVTQLQLLSSLHTSQGSPPAGVTPAPTPQ